MKLASYKDGSRDGQLVVVSRDLASAHYATGIATRLQQVLDDWNFLSPQLEDLYTTLNHGRGRHAFPFDPRLCMAPLPRACQWAEGAAYPSHGERVHGMSHAQAEGAGLLMRQGASDDFLGPCDDIAVPSEKMGIDFGAGLAVVTGDVAMGTPADAALESIRLALLANSVSLRQLAPAELARGFCLVHSQPATAFGPVAVTLDELGPVWQGGRAHLAVQSSWNGKRFGLCDTGPEMAWHFGELIAHLCQTRRVRAGSLVGSGTVSNQDATRGFSCVAEKRALEAREHGEPKTEFLRFGDTLRIEVKGPDGQSLFGAIDQAVAEFVR